MKYDFVFLVEHPKREMHFINMIANNLNELGYNSKIYSITFDIHKLLFIKSPKVILLPYCLSSNDWPFSFLKYLFSDSLFCNINWEQNLHEISKKFRIPKGDALNIYNLVWNSDFRNYLIKSGVNKEQIKKSINPTSFLFKQKITLSKFSEHLDNNKIVKDNYIFFPMNYNWLFYGKVRLKKKIKSGYSLTDANKYIEFSKLHFKYMISFILSILKKTKYSIVIRPHPSITVDDYYNYIRKNYKELLKYKSRVHISDEFTVNEWIRFSSLNISNWSSVIFDSMMAGYKSYYFYPIKVPDYLQANYLREGIKIKSIDEISKHKIQLSNADNLIVVVKSLIEILNNNSKFIYSKKIKFFDLLKIQRSVIFNFLVKINLKFLIPNRFIADIISEK